VRLDDRLRQADRRWVPRAAAQLRRLVDGAGERRERAASTVRNSVSGALDPAGDGPLRRLDDRYASHGPLALLRDVPQLGLLLVAAVFISGAGVALARSGTQHRADTTRQRAEATIPTTLGPPPGSNIAAYVAATRKRARLVSQAAPDGMYTALVSFSRYLTPQQTRLLLAELEVKKVLAHVQLPSAEVLPIPVTSTLVEDVQTTFSEIAKRKVRDRKEFLNLASSITGTAADEKQYKAFYTEAAKTAGKEASAYGRDCACVFAALVRGKARDLAVLPALSGVRAVDIGGGDDDTLQLQPLLPEQKVTVTRPIVPAGGNGA
jgi:hypothetical protein